MNTDKPNDVVRFPASEPVRTEPRNITLADLIVLVAGCAIAVAPNRHYWSTIQVLAGRSQRPLWYASLWDLSAFVMATGVAIGLVAIVRRLRYGGKVSPGEFVAVASCMELIHYGTQLICGMLGRMLDATLTERHDIIILGHTIVIAAGCTAVVRGRRRSPEWITALNLAVAWSGLSYWCSTVSKRQAMTGRYEQIWSLNALLTLPVPDALRLLAAWVLFLGFYVLEQVGRPLPFMVALRSPTRSNRMLPWTSAAGLRVCLVGWALGTVMTLGSFCVDFGSVSLAWRMTSAIQFVVLEMLAWVVSYILVRRYGAAIDRWWDAEPTTPAEAAPDPDLYSAPTT